MFKKENTYYILLLFLVAIVAFWQISFLQSTLKYDMIDCFFPWRFIVAEHIKNGMLPLWNPYQTLGYPLFADMSNGASWYPPVWINGFLFGYNIYVVSLELILHVFLAGLGMFFLGKSLKLSSNTAFIMGVAYMLSGVFIGNAQHLNILVTAAWLPYVFTNYLYIIKTPKIYYVLKTSIYLFLYISGGYPSFTITLAYILLVVFFLYAVFLIYKKELGALKKFILYNVYLAIFTCLICCVVFLSYSDIAPELARTEGVSLKAAMLNPFSPQCLISFLLPFAVIKELEFFNTDPSVTSIYIGIIPIIFLIYCFFIKKSKTFYFFLVFSVLFLMVSMGDYLPLRKLLYDYVPVMNMFRFPGFLRIFSIFGFVICSGYAMDYTFNNFDKARKPILVISSILVLLFVGVLVYARYLGYLEMKQFILNDIFNESLSSRITQHIAFQSVIQIVVLLSIIIALRFLKRPKFIFLLFGIITVVEMGVAAQLNAPYTVFYKDIKQKDVFLHQKNNFINAFPVPTNQFISENTNVKLSYGPFWRNVTIFHKQISNEGFTSLLIKNYRDLIVKHADLLYSILNNPPAFLTTDIAPFDSLSCIPIKPQRAFCEAESFSRLKALINYDTSAYTLTIKEFKPSEIVLETSSSVNQILVLMQNNYNGWSAMVNNKKEEIVTVNKSLIGVFVPAGNNSVVITFKKPLIVLGFYISIISLLLVLVLCFYIKFKKHNTYF